MEGEKRDFVKMQSLPFLSKAELASYNWAINATFLLCPSLLLSILS